MPPPQPPLLPEVDPPGHSWEDCKQILADELSAHRQRLQQCLEEWTQEQDGIFERAIARISVSSVPQQQTAAGADTPEKLVAYIPRDDGDVTLNRGFSSFSKRSFSTLGDSTEDVHHQFSALEFQRRSSRKKKKATFKSTVMSKLSDIVYSKYFDSLCATVILANAVLLGMASDYAMSNLKNPNHPAISAVELGFCCFYAVEVCLRIAVLGLGFFRSADWKWNCFDLALVIMSIWDEIEARLNISASALENLSFLRLLRLMKMLKLLRIIRLMRMFRELRLILYSVLGCVQAMFWASVLIFTTSYMFAICFLQACTHYLQAHDQADLNPDIVSGISEYWSSIGTIMLSLYMAGTAGREWSGMAESLRSVGLPFYSLFLLYIAFFAFVVMNTVTSLFIEAMMAHADKDQQAVIQLELEKKNNYISKLQDFYDEMDADGDGHVSFEEFCNHYEKPPMQAFAASLEIDVTDAKQFFSILSDNGSRNVDVETFVVGCIKLKGAARSMDLMDLVYAHRQAHSEAQMCAEEHSKKMDTLEKMLKKQLVVPPRRTELETMEQSETTM